MFYLNHDILPISHPHHTTCVVIKSISVHRANHEKNDNEERMNCMTN